jgi:hypothetical protein
LALDWLIVQYLHTITNFKYGSINFMV